MSASAAGLALGASIKHTTTTEDGVNSRLDYPFFLFFFKLEGLVSLN